MRFSTKLIVLSIIPATVLAVAALMGVASNLGAEQRFSTFFEKEQARATAVAEMYAQGLQMAQALRNIVLDPSNRKAYDNFDAATTDYTAAAATASRLTVVPQEAEQLAAIAEFRERHVRAQQRVLELIKTDAPAAVALLNKEDTPVWREMRSRLLAMGKTSRAALQASREQALAETRRSAIMAVGMVVFGLALACAFPLLMRRMLLRDLGGEPETARDLVQAVSNGDLTRATPLRGGDSSSLLAYLAAMRQSLADMIAGLRTTAGHVEVAVVQIAQGNNDLSARTEQQASALEETAASMEELSSTVAQNADNAKQANQLALRASTVAVEGGQVVGQVVETMKGINDSSKKIADIISVIDGIAFQTNILALNAAVEAARAGEQGRGFAVVASEVRSLAGRSADAAKEIKQLITDSVERVAQGTALVDQAGATMSEVVSSIRRVTDIMGEISAASQEQSSGVAQVGEAVQQMDQATQQNAALVEESAAAAEGLKGQARQLMQAVAVFKLEPGTAAQAPSAARPATAAPVERRGPDRATNVTRPAFSAKSKPSGGLAPASPQQPPTLTDVEPPRKTGTDGEWTSF